MKLGTCMTQCISERDITWLEGEKCFSRFSTCNYNCFKSLKKVLTQNRNDLRTVESCWCGRIDVSLSNVAIKKVGKTGLGKRSTFILLRYSFLSARRAWIINKFLDKYFLDRWEKVELNLWTDSRYWKWEQNNFQRDYYL